jgi:hypothetical protein
VSVSFRGPKGSLDLANGNAAKFLKAFGVPEEAWQVGSLPLVDARIGLDSMKNALTDKNDIQLLVYFEELLNEISDEGGDVVEWY